MIMKKKKRDCNIREERSGRDQPEVGGRAQELRAAEAVIEWENGRLNGAGELPADE